jgi:hypothetical protein
LATATTRLGHRHHQAQVGLNHALLGAAALAQGLAQGRLAEAPGPGHRGQVGPDRFDGGVLIQDPLAVLDQPRQEEILFLREHGHPANVSEVLTDNIGGGGAAQGDGATDPAWQNMDLKLRIKRFASGLPKPPPGASRDPSP